MKIIVATEKDTNTRYGYCINSGVSWFAPLTSLCLAKLPILKAEARVRELKLQQLVFLFRKDNNGVSTDIETVNLNRFTLALEEPF